MLRNRNQVTLRGRIEGGEPWASASENRVSKPQESLQMPPGYETPGEMADDHSYSMSAYENGYSRLPGREQDESQLDRLQTEDGMPVHYFPKDGNP